MAYDRDILVAEFLLTSASRGPSAIAELLVFSPTILLLYDVTRGSPDDEFQEFCRYVMGD